MKKTEFDAFSSQVKEAVESIIRKDYELQPTIQKKINEDPIYGEVNALVFSTVPSGSDKAIESVVDMTYAYHLHKNGVPVEDIVSDSTEMVLEQFSIKADPTYEQIDIADLKQNWSAAMDKIVMEVVANNLVETDCAKATGLQGKKRNEDILAGIPHTEICDLAIVYRVLTASGEGFLITNRELENYGISTEKLHKQALKTAPVVLPAAISDMAADTRGAVMPKTMLSVSTDVRAYGAAALFYPGVLRKCATRMGGDIFILPNSIYGFYTILDDGIQNSAGLTSVVRRLYQQNPLLMERERLTDHAYHYDLFADKFETCNQWEVRKCLAKIEGK